MKDNIKSLKALGLEIANAENLSTAEWLSAAAKLYEQLLLVDYLEKRNTSLEAIESQLVHQISKVIESDTPPISAPELPETSLENISQEVRKVPVPQGPPVSVNQTSIYTELAERGAVEEIEPKVEKKTKAPEPKVEKTVEEPKSPKEKSAKAPSAQAENKVSIAEKAAHSPKKSLNDKLSGSALKFGLNDRIAFVKHLFNGSQEDFNRVVSQLNSFANKQEASDFLEHIVKPEYNWKNKEEFAERFMESVENRFS